MIDPADLIKESKRGGKGVTPFGEDDAASPERIKTTILPGVNVIIWLSEYLIGADEIELACRSWRVNWPKCKLLI